MPRNAADVSKSTKMPEENKIEGTVNAVKGLVEAVPIYQDVVQPAAKEVGTALQTVAKSIHVLLAPVSALVWGYDQIKNFVTTRVAEKLKDVPFERLRAPDPLVGGPVLEALRYAGHKEELCEMYATLLASAMDSNFAGEVRAAFVDIIKQLEAADAHILHAGYVEYSRIEDYLKQKPWMRRKHEWNSPLGITIDARKLRQSLELDERPFEIALDNLVRLRCMAPFVETQEIDVVDYGQSTKRAVSAFYNYEQLCITALGIEFVEACMSHRTVKPNRV